MHDTTHLLGMKLLTFNLLISPSINLKDKSLANVLPSKKVVSRLTIFIVLKLAKISRYVVKSEKM